MVIKKVQRRTDSSLLWKGRGQSGDSNLSLVHSTEPLTPAATSAMLRKVAAAPPAPRSGGNNSQRKNADEFF